MERRRDGAGRSGATPKDEADAKVSALANRNKSEARAIRDRYGVDDLQVRRDHAISQILAAISAQAPDDFYFIGGTAINRTHVTPGRLSEDIDLIAVNDRATTVTLFRRGRVEDGSVDGQTSLPRSVRPALPCEPRAVFAGRGRPFVRMGPTGRKPARWMFTQGPLDD